VAYIDQVIEIKLTGRTITVESAGGKPGKESAVREDVTKML
jgi:hypothetical protein